MARPSRPTPLELTRDWPETPSSDPDAEAVRLFVVALRDFTWGLSLRRVATRCQVNHATLAKLVAGESWPDVRTLARLERGLESSLWPIFGTTGTHIPTATDVILSEAPEQLD